MTSCSLYLLKYTVVPSERAMGATSAIRVHASLGHTDGMVCTLAFTKEKKEKNMLGHHCIFVPVQILLSLLE